MTNRDLDRECRYWMFNKLSHEESTKTNYKYILKEKEDLTIGAFNGLKARCKTARLWPANVA
jgi:hypothetical protein